MSLKKIKELLKNREFISVATSDLEAHPNAAPKFFLKIEGHFIYLIDYTFGKTWQNLKINPLISLSLVNTNTLTGYQINGVVEIIDKGKEFVDILEELSEKELQLSTKRIVEGVTSGKSHGDFEVAFKENFVILKVSIKEITEISPRGELKKEIL